MTKHSPTITTIITTYKRPQLLKRAVLSVLEQTYSNFQVCVYDNASGDETQSVMQELMQQDSRVKYHCHSKNIGMMPNYEFAFSQINTPYFTFLSDDDFFLPCFYETALQGFDKYPDAGFSACSSVQVNEDGIQVGEPLSSWKKEGCYNIPEGILSMIEAHGKWPIPTTILFQTSKVKNLKPDWTGEIQAMWDPDYLLQIACEFPIVISKKKCGIYFVHQNSFCGSFFSQALGSAKSFENYMILSTKVLKRLLENPSLPNPVKNKAKRNYSNMMRQEVSMHMRNYVFHIQFDNAYHTAKVVQKYYGMGLEIRLLFLFALASLYFPPFSFGARVLFSCVRRANSFLKKVKDYCNFNNERKSFLNCLSNNCQQK